jgi:nitroreductase
MHPDIPAADLPARRAALDLLLSRHSPWPLTGPVPDADDLKRVFDAAMRAPDHGQIRPWRFITIRDDARTALGEVYAQAAREREPGSDGERFRTKAMAAPLIIAIVVSPAVPHKVPVGEQELAVAAAAMNMLNALHMLGYGGFWATGLNSYDRRVTSALGVRDAERLVGFLYVGTPKEPSSPPTRPASAPFVTEWTGPVA